MRPRTVNPRPPTGAQTSRPYYRAQTAKDSWALSSIEEPQVSSSPLPLFTKPSSKMGGNLPYWNTEVAQANKAYLPEPVLNLGVIDHDKTKPQLIAELQLLRGGGTAITNLQGLRQEIEELTDKLAKETGLHEHTSRALAATQTALKTASKYAEDLKTVKKRQLADIKHLKTCVCNAEKELKKRDKHRIKLEEHITRVNSEKVQLHEMLTTTRNQAEQLTSDLDVTAKELKKTHIALTDAQNTIGNLKQQFRDEMNEMKKTVKGLMKILGQKDAEIARQKDEFKEMQIKLQHQIVELEEMYKESQFSLLQARDQVASQKQQMSEMQDELDVLRPIQEQYIAAKAKIKDLEAEIASLQTQISDLQQQIGKLEARIQQLEEVVTEQEAKIAELQEANSNANQALKKEIEERAAENEKHAEEVKDFQNKIEEMKAQHAKELKEKDEEILQQNLKIAKLHQDLAKQAEKHKEQIEEQKRLADKVLRESLEQQRKTYELEMEKKEMETIAKLAAKDKEITSLQDEAKSKEVEHAAAAAEAAKQIQGLKRSLSRASQAASRAASRVSSRGETTPSERRTTSPRKSPRKSKLSEVEEADLPDNLEGEDFDSEEYDEGDMEGEDLHILQDQQEDAAEGEEQSEAEAEELEVLDEPYVFPKLQLPKEALSVADSLRVQLNSTRDLYRKAGEDEKLHRYYIQRLVQANFLMSKKLGCTPLAEELGLELENFQDPEPENAPPQQQNEKENLDSTTKLPAVPAELEQLKLQASLATAQNFSPRIFDEKEQQQLRMRYSKKGTKNSGGKSKKRSQKKREEGSEEGGGTWFNTYDDRNE